MLAMTEWDKPHDVLFSVDNVWNATFKLAQYLDVNAGAIRTYGRRKLKDGNIVYHFEVHRGYLQADDYYAYGTEEEQS